MSKPRFPLMSDSFDENAPSPTPIRSQFPLPTEHTAQGWHENVSSPLNSSFEKRMRRASGSRFQKYLDFRNGKGKNPYGK